MTVKRFTLAEHLKEFNVTIIDRQPASMVSPAYRGKPKELQIATGVGGVEEILLSNDKSAFICSDCTNVFDSSNSANSHRSRCAIVAEKKIKKQLAAPIATKEDVAKARKAVADKKAAKATPNSVATRQKNISKAATANALTYPQVMQKLKDFEAKYRKEFDEWCKAMENKNAEVENLKRANAFLQMTIDQLQREREDWESEIAGLKRKIDEFENPKTALDRRLVVAVEIALEDLREKFEKAYAIQLEADKRIAESLS